MKSSLPRRSFFLSTGLLAALTTFNAHAFYEVGGGVLTLSTTGRVTYDSNINGNSMSEDDVIYSVIPTLRYERRAGLSKLTASATADFSSFSSKSSESYQDFSLNATATFPLPAGSRLSGGASLGYARTTEVNNFVNDRFTTDVISAGLNASYRLRPRLSLISGLAYTDSNPQDSQYSDMKTQSGTIGFNIAELWQQLSVGASYTISKNETSSPVGPTSNQRQSLDNTDHNVSLNLSGPIPQNLLRKVTFTASLGVQETNSSRNDSSSGRTMVGSLSAGWQARPRTNVNLGATRSVALTPNDFTAETTAVTLNATQGLGPKMNANAGISQSWSDFRGSNRQDSVFTANTGLSRTFNRYWNAGVSYSYTNSSSEGAVPTNNQNMADYDRHVVSATLTYVF